MHHNMVILLWHDIPWAAYVQRSRCQNRFRSTHGTPWLRFHQPVARQNLNRPESHDLYRVQHAVNRQKR
jgi:hypothetical protein